MWAGVATSSNGVDWERLPSASSASPSATAAQDQKKKDTKQFPQGQGCVMQPGEDWWTFDTCHMAVSDVQVGARAWLSWQNFTADSMIF